MIVKNLEKKEHSTAMFQVEIDAEAFENAKNTAYKKEKGQMFIAGFRKGKAPRVVIEGMYGKDVFTEGAVQELAPDAFEFAVEQEKLNCVGMPSIVSFDTDDSGALTITFVTDVYPEVTLGQYKDLEADGAAVEVTDEELDQAIQDARKRAARLVDVKRPVAMGDTIVFDFEGFVDGVPFEGGKSEEYTLEIGSGMFIPGFEDQMVGKEIEEESEINVTFPENYDPKLAGKAATFKVKVHGVKEPQYPELDDEFAKDISEFDTFEEYKADERKQLLEMKQEQADSEYHSGLMTKAIDGMTAEIPEGMIAEKIDEFIRSYADNMGMGGRMTRADLFRSLGISEESFAQMARPNALKQVQSDLLLDKIVEVENIEVSQEDKDEFYKQIEADYGEEAEKIRGMIDEKLMIRDLSRRKAAELIYSTGKKVAPASEAEKPAEETKEEKKPARKPRAKKEAVEGEEKPAAKKSAAKKAKTEDTAE